MNNNNQFSSSVFCNHANECPSGDCECPSNCACRETMCKEKVDQSVIDELVKTPEPASVPMSRANIRITHGFVIELPNGKRDLVAYSPDIDNYIILRNADIQQNPLDKT